MSPVSKEGRLGSLQRPQGWGEAKPSLWSCRRLEVGLGGPSLLKIAPVRLGCGTRLVRVRGDVGARPPEQSSLAAPAEGTSPEPPEGHDRTPLQRQCPQSWGPNSPSEWTRLLSACFPTDRQGFVCEAVLAQPREAHS